MIFQKNTSKQLYFSLSNLFLFCLIFISACKKDNPILEEINSPAQYYPLIIGKFIVYDVDSIQYHETAPTDTSYFQVKETLVDTFYDADNRLNYKIERYTRPSDTANWNLTNVWSVLYIDNQLQKIENNLRFIKLVSPLRNDVRWEGNIYLGGLSDLPVEEECNNWSYLEDWNYTYKNIGVSKTINGLPFQKTVTVIQEGDSNLIWYEYAEEIYGENVGLIQKDFYHYYTQDFNCIECPWEQRVQCGYSVKMLVVDYN